MDMPPSGWYPDPYGVPGLLRWWDGATWTEHTYAETAPAAPAGAGPATASPAATTVQPAVTRVQPAVQPTAIQPGTIQPTAIQPGTIQPATAGPTAGPTAEPTAVQPGMQLSTLGPPTGPRTTPQPAIPAGPQEGAGEGTRVLVLDSDAWNGDAWNGNARNGDARNGSAWSDSTWAPSGAPALPESDYQRAQRRRRMLGAAGLAGGVVAALVVIGLVVKSLGQSSPPPAAAATPTAHAVASPAAAGSPTPSASPSLSASPASLATVTDETSGLAYSELPAPFGPGCPPALSNPSFTWTAGESATAGQVNNGQTTWYGEACSGPLPAAYGYNGTTDLQNVATTLVNTFNGTYYAALPHTMAMTVNEPTAISGHPAWEIQFEMTYTSAQGMAFTSELGTVVVADPQTGVAPAVFYASVPANLNEGNVATLLSSLQLAAVAPPPTASATASATAPAPGNGSAAAGAPATLP